MSFLLDTNVISELKKPRPNAGVSGFIASLPLESFYLSSVTYAEIRFGIELQPLPAKRALLESWFTHTVMPMFIGRVLQATEDVLFDWLLMMDKGRKANLTFPQPDVLIAATALHHGLTIVTRNTGDFARMPVLVHNPWL